MSLDRFLEEISYFNAAMTNIDTIMEGADLLDDSYYVYVFERLSSAATTLHKASFYYSTIPDKVKSDMATSIYTRALKLRKVHRAIVIWLMYSRDMEVLLATIEGDSTTLFSSDSLVTMYKQICTTLDLIIRSVDSDSLELVQYGYDKINFVRESIEDLMDLSSIIQYSEVQKDFLDDMASDIEDVLNLLEARSKRRLGIE